MHTEEINECVFWAKCLASMNVWDYAYLGRSWDDYFFIKKMDGKDEYVVKEIATLSDETIADRMRDDFDAHDAWVDAVRNWDTDESYDSWQQDIDIWDELDSSNYYSCPDEIVDILYNIWLWSSEYASDDWYYLDVDQSYTLTRERLDRLFNYIDTDKEFNSNLWNDIESKFGVHQVEFLAAEPIR